MVLVSFERWHSEVCFSTVRITVRQVLLILSNSTLNTLKKEKNNSACIFFVNRSLQMTIAGRYELDNTLGSQNEALPSQILHLINIILEN